MRSIGARSGFLALTGMLNAPVPAMADTLNVNGIVRTYSMVAPAANGRLPLVLALHGLNGNGDQTNRYTGWGDQALQQRFVAAFPNARNGSWAIGIPPASNPDVAFLNKLIATLVANKTVDPRRVYIIGTSQGGFMTAMMVCTKAQLFAAASPVIAGVQEGFDRRCQPFRPVPMLLINGTADKIVPFAGGYGTGPTASNNLIPTPMFAAIWRQINGCSDATTERQVPDVNRADKSTVTVISSTCPSSRDVELYRVNGGGHQQPNTSRLGDAVESQLGPQNHDINGAAVIWEFFKRFAL